MKNLFSISVSLFLLVVLMANAGAQSGRKIVRPAATGPLPPVQAPVFTPPNAEPERVTVTSEERHSLPESLLKRSLQSLDNSSFRLGDFSGKVIVVNLWASWCGPCRREVPDYENVRKEFAGRNVEFVGLTTEDPRTSGKRVREFVRNLNFGFRLGWADDATARTLSNGSRAIPQTLVIAPGGRVVSHWEGYARGHSVERLRSAILEGLSGVASAATESRGHERVRRL
ncbi:MAG TPA: TlpA disulfide reductase family protein [Pyrinomonadaceae bacterium]|jgi:thiol-disulfide isomerase/thioredoxin|nr:TlpA disulfide reductase family protein [Pyrinomonadaceae bacterium]